MRSGIAKIWGLLAGVMMWAGVWGQTYPKWTGTGNWSNTGNWSTGTYPYDQLEFIGGGAAISNNDLAPASQWRIFFNGTQQYTITGNAIHLFDYGTNPSQVLSQSTVLQTINPLVSFRDNSGGNRQAWITTRNTGGFQFGNLELAGNVSLLRMSGETTNGGITIGGVLSSGLNIPVIVGRDETNTIRPNTRVTYNGVNTYAGNTEIDAGELWIGTGNISSGTVFVGNGTVPSETAKLWLSTAAGGTTFARPITINPGNANTREIGGLNSSGTHTFSGNITNNSTNGLVLSSLNAGGTNLFSGVISVGNPIALNGAGTIILSGDNTFNATATVNSGTTVKQGSANRALGSVSTGSVVLSGGVFDINGFTVVNNEPITINGTGISNGGAITNNPIVASNATWGGSITLGSSSSVIAANGNLSLTSTTAISGTGFGLTLGGNSNGSLAASIQTGASGTLTKNGNGTWTLTGGSTYGGVSGSATTINAGTLQISGAADRLPIATALSIANGATFDLNSQNQQVGSLSSITTGGAVSLGSGTLTVGNASNTTFSGNISGSAGSLTKVNAGTLILSGTNSYTGTTTITAGRLEFNSNASLASGSTISLGGGTMAVGNTPTALSSGALNMTTSSLIDLGTGSNNFNLSFSGVGITFTGTLTINNWSGTAGKEIILPNLTGPQLAQINFTGYGTGAKYDVATANRIIPAFLYETVSTGSGLLTNSGSWTNGIPPDNACGSNPASIVIRGTFNLTQDQNRNFSRVEVTSGATYTASANTITLCAGANFINNGIVNFTSSATVVCNGSATFSGTAPSASFALNNLTLSAATTFNAAPTISGSLEMNTGSSVITNSPFYTSSSTLFYNGTTFSRGLEWATGVSTFTSAGYPNHVTIGSNIQACAFSAVNNAALQMGGNLTIGGSSSAASSLTLSENSVNVRPLTVVGNVLVNTTGTLTLGFLSSPNAGDILVSGNFTNNGTFTHNQRAVFFNGTSDQTIAGNNFTGTGTTNCLPYLIVNKVTGRLLLGSPVNVAGVTNPIVTLTNGNLVLGSHNLELTSGGTFAGSPFNTSKMVVADGSGQLKYSVPPASNISYFFPVGDVTGTPEYSPITILLNNIGAGGSFGINVTNSAHPNINNPTTLKSINRYWNVTTSTLNNYTWTGNFTYLDADLQPSGTTDEASLRGNVWYPAPVNGWELLGGSIDPATNVVTITGGNLGSLKDGAITARIYVPLYYTTAGAGPADWSWLSSWLASTDPGFTSPPGVTPSFAPSHINSAAINIQQGHTINVTSDYSADELTLNGILNIEAGGRFGLNNGTGTDLSISGTGRLNLNDGIYGSDAGTTTTISSSGYFYNKLAGGNAIFLGTANFSNNSTYQHDVNGGTIPTATWQSGSNVIITGITSSNIIGNLGQAFSNFTWNCLGQNQAIGLGGDLVNIGGNFTVLSTGSPSRELRLFSNASSLLPNTLNVGGNLIMQGGILVLTNSSTNTPLGINQTINVLGNTQLTGGGIILAGDNATAGSNLATLNISGSLEISSLSSTLNLTSNTATGILNVGGNLNLSAGSIRKTGGGAGSLNLVKPSGEQIVNIHSAGINLDNVAVNIGNGTTTNTVSLNGNFALNSAAVLSVLNNARLNSNTFITTGGTFTLSSAGTLGVGSPLGITFSGSNGNIQTTNRTFPGSANYIFNGSVDQVTGSGLPSSITGSLQIANSGIANNTVTLTTNGTTTSNLTLTSGRLAVGNGQTLNIANGGQIDIPASGGAGAQATGLNAGTINFNGGGNVSNVRARQIGLPNLTNVITNGTVSFSGGQASNATIQGFLQLNANSVISNSPFYATGSTLVYKTVGPYNRTTEWGNVPNAPGYPWHVTVEAGTTVNLGSNPVSFDSLYMGGNLQLGTDFGAGTVNMSGIDKPFSIGGNLIVGSTNGSGTGVFNMNNVAKPVLVKGNVEIGANGATGSSFNMSTVFEGDLWIGGNFTRYNGSDFTNNNRAVFLHGQSDATISTPGVSAPADPSSNPNQYFDYLYLVKHISAGTVPVITLETPVGVTLEMGLTNGILTTTSANILSIRTGGGITGGNDNSFVNGPMAKRTNNGVGNPRNDFTFPIGKNGTVREYRPAQIAEIVPDGSIITTYTAEFFQSGSTGAGGWQTHDNFNDATLVGVYKNQYWQIDKSPTGGTNGARVGLYYKRSLDDFFPTSYRSTSAVAVVKFYGTKGDPDDSWQFTQQGLLDMNNGPYFEALPGNNTSFDWVYTIPETDFSPFTIGFGDNRVLPLRLLTFTAALHGPDALLHFTLADAKDLKQFEVEHSNDGQVFSRIATIGHNGGTDYHYRHANLPAGVHYYRLKLVEKDGRSAYSKVEVLMVNTNRTLVAGLMQNPIQGGQAVLKIYSANNQDAEAVVLDMAGRMLLRQKLSLQTGYNQPSLSLLLLPSGMYKMLIRTRDGVEDVLTVVK